MKKYFFEYVLFFILTAFVVTCSILLYDATKDLISSKEFYIMNFFNVIFISFLITCIASFTKRVMYKSRIEKIFEATKKISDGDFNVNLVSNHSYNSYDELDQIMENINMMASELKKNEILKNDFISNVSHEIKTPIAVIDSYSKALAGVDDKTRTEFIKVICQNTTKLKDLITNILVLNRLENDVVETKTEDICLSESIASSVMLYDDLLTKKNIELVSDLQDIKIKSVPSYLGIIWNNILSNAIKFSPQDSQIEIKLYKENNYAVFLCSDHGPGFDKSVGDRIFEKFYQGDTSHKTEGNGLGLALVKRVIDLLGGKIQVKSKMNQGTTFKVSMRLED